jgi:hypothetical protein
MKDFIKCFAFALVLALAFSACKKDEPYDPCEDKTCFNGGVCDDGRCDCPPGFSGSECEIQDLCYNITCLNGGQCVNGTCDCPTGYSGPSCATVLTPVSMTITRVVVTNYPLVQSTGAGWDPTTGADPFITHNEGTTPNLNYYKASPWSNVTGQDLEYSTAYASDNLPYTVNNLNNSHTLYLWDYDSSTTQDGMAGVYYTPLASSSGFPDSFVLSTSKLTARVYVTWNF